MGLGLTTVLLALLLRRTVTRLITVLLGLICLLIMFLTLLLRRKRSGIYADPSSIATAASLLHHLQIVIDFRRVNPMVTKSTIAELLGNKRYRLSHYNTSAGV